MSTEKVFQEKQTFIVDLYSVFLELSEEKLKIENEAYTLKIDMANLIFNF